MTRFTVPSIIVSVVVMLLAIVAIVLGLNLVPDQAESIEKGIFAPWVIVWMMIVVTVVCAFALAAFLFQYAMKGLSGKH